MCLLNICNLLIYCIVFQLLDIPVSASKIQYASGYTPQCRSLTQILHQKGFVVFFLQSRHAVVHHQLRLLRQIYSHFWLDPTKQEGLQDPLQLSSCKQKHSTRDTVCQCWFYKQLTRLSFFFFCLTGLFHNNIKYISNYVPTFSRTFPFKTSPLIVCTFVLTSLKS